MVSNPYGDLPFQEYLKRVNVLGSELSKMVLSALKEIEGTIQCIVPTPYGPLYTDSVFIELANHLKSEVLNRTDIAKLLKAKYIELYGERRYRRTRHYYRMIEGQQV